MTSTFQPSLTLPPPSIGLVRCFSCNRDVRAQITTEPDMLRHQLNMVPLVAQKCPRCKSSLDAAVVVDCGGE